MRSQQPKNPRIVLISQWPKVKNAEYELIEKIRQTGFKIAVVDYFGFDVETDKCINDATFADEYDFAISFHYDTPKFLNIPTFLWVANPLEYMHLRGDYRSVLIHHLRSYDSYLFNGSDLLKNHIKRVVGNEWKDDALMFFASCSRQVMLKPRVKDNQNNTTANKIFYCGVNWERGTDKSGRAQGLLDLLQEQQAADFYGPRMLEGTNPWEGFSSYCGEIPFDGISMSKIMQDYGAVLAVSSPAHIKSCTSSSRVFEGFTAGVPVISDENPHVRKLFGDLVYYFSGETEKERAESILKALGQIRSNPDEAFERVRQAQEKIAREYCFEECLSRLLSVASLQSEAVVDFADKAESSPIIDMFLFNHDPYAEFGSSADSFLNVSHILKAAESVIQQRCARVRIYYDDSNSKQVSNISTGSPKIEWIALSSESPLMLNTWSSLRLGEKVARLASLSSGDFTVFLTQTDYIHHDYLVKAIDWHSNRKSKDITQQDGLFVGGFFVSNLSVKAQLGTTGILRNNMSVGFYRWTQNSIAEHQLGQYCFSRKNMQTLDFEGIASFDVLFPIAIMLQGLASNIQIHRSRHILLRVLTGYFHRHYEAYGRAVMKGFWAQHYELLSNYSHELNGLYDAFHEYPFVVEIVDQVSGQSLNTVIQTDPAVHAVNQFIGRLRPIYRTLRKMKNVLTLKAP